MAAKYILPTLALAGAALAQCSGDLTIHTSSDASGIQDCQTYKGDVTIADDASGTIQLNGVQAISGDLIVNNATQLTAITSDQLNAISGTFSLTGLTILSTLQFDSLSAVNKINWIGLPALQQLNFNQGISRANSIVISNTQLNTLTGIELTAVGSMNINNNPYLTTINVNGLKNVTNALSFSANGRDLEISFPNLEAAANLTFRNVSSISMPSLSSVQGDMGFYSDTFESFAAPNLTKTGGSLAIVDSPDLKSLSFPQLQTIGGGFLIANNTNLKSIVGFPKLTTIVGALDFAGTFNAVSLPRLHDVRGGDNVQTTSTNSSICDSFDQAVSLGIIKGVNNCVTSKANPQTSDTSGSGSSSSSTSSGAASPAIFDPSAPMTGVWAIIAALLFI
ncbi:hypothetical protein DV736_g3354, partial [Chaetothyriales sp. CBS 134916]